MRLQFNPGAKGGHKAPHDSTLILRALYQFTFVNSLSKVDFVPADFLTAHKPFIHNTSRYLLDQLQPAFPILWMRSRVKTVLKSRHKACIRHAGYHSRARPTPPYLLGLAPQSVSCSLPGPPSSCCSPPGSHIRGPTFIMLYQTEWAPYPWKVRLTKLV